MPRSSQITYLMQICLTLLLVDSCMTSVNAEPATPAGSDKEHLYRRLDGPGTYDRRKALKELMYVVPEDPKSTEVLIRIFQSKQVEEPQFSDFMKRVARALVEIAASTTWTPQNVELLTSTLVHNDAYDSRAVGVTASAVTGVAQYQTFSSKAIGDLTTVLWHRVDKNPNRSRSDNTRTDVAKAFRHLLKRQILPEEVIDSFIQSLTAESHGGVRRQVVLLIDDLNRTKPATDPMVEGLTQMLRTDRSATLRALVARSLGYISKQRNYPRGLIDEFHRALVQDSDAAVRRYALAGLKAATSVYRPSQAESEVLAKKITENSDAKVRPEVLGILARSNTRLQPETVSRLLQAVEKDPSTEVRLLALETLGNVYAAKTPDEKTLETLLERLALEPDRRVRSLVAATLREIRERQVLFPVLTEQLTALITDDPLETVRSEIRHIVLGQTSAQGLADWLEATKAMGMLASSTQAPTSINKTLLGRQILNRPELHKRLLSQYQKALEEGRPRAVRQEILQGLFALSLTEPLPDEALDILSKSMLSDQDANLRRQAAAVLLHLSKQYPTVDAPFYQALDDGDMKVRNYAAFALVELAAASDNVAPTLIGFAGDRSAHRQLRLYCLRRLSLWHRAATKLPSSAQAPLLNVTQDPDTELRREAWTVLGQFNLSEADWRKATQDDDPAIRRMAWRQLKALGVSKPVSAKWQDSKERQELIALGLLATTVLVLITGSVFFGSRLFFWFQSGRQQTGRMIGAQLIWLTATLWTVIVNAGIIFTAGMSHSGISEKDMMQMNTVIGAILGLYVAAAFLCWKLLPGSKTYKLS